MTGHQCDLACRSEDLTHDVNAAHQHLAPEEVDRTSSDEEVRTFIIPNPGPPLVGHQCLPVCQQHLKGRMETA